MLSEMLSSFSLVAIAELGDKSQLACLALAARYPPRQVLLGAVLAFGLLNGVAVIVGSAVGASVPENLARGLAALLFAGFGVHTLWTSGEEHDGEQDLGDKSRHPVLAVMTLLALAELGDKTQLSVAALASVQSPLATWVGATLALTGTSALAISLGRWLLPRLPPIWLARVTGVLFLSISVWLAWSALPAAL